jgi:hypothetical protein
VLGKRLEDLDYRIAQFRREGDQEERLRRRRTALLRAHHATVDRLEDLNDVLIAEERKLQGSSLFHRGLERRMVEDVIAVENLEVFKAAGCYPALRERLEDLESEVSELNGILEHRRDHHDHVAMLQEWRGDLYQRSTREDRGSNKLLHGRLDLWLKVADLEDDLEDIGSALSLLEEALLSLEAAIAAGTRVREVTKRDLAVLANIQPQRTRQFLLMEVLRNAREAYRHASVVVDTLQGVEHLRVHVREPVRILTQLLEALLLDHYEGGVPRHALRELHEHHKYLVQVRGELEKRVTDVRLEVGSLQVEEDQLLMMAVERRLKKRTPLSRF